VSGECALPADHRLGQAFVAGGVEIEVVGDVPAEAGQHVGQGLAGEARVLLGGEPT
jgi:hypothetical protein